MRGLQTGQTADLATTTADAKIMRQKLELGEDDALRLEHVLQNANRVEGEQKGRDAFFVLRLHLQNLIEEQLWKQMDDLDALFETFKRLEHYFVESTKVDHVSKLKQSQGEMSVKTAVEQLKQSMLAPLRKNLVLREMIPTIEEEFDAFVDWEKLPTKVLGSDGDDQESVVEVETEVIEEQVDEQELELELEQELEQEQLFSLPRGRFISEDLVQWNGDYHSHESDERKEWFGVSVVPSPNLYRLIDIHETGSMAVKGRGDAVSYIARKPAYQSVLRVDKRVGSVSLIPTDLNDMEIVLKRMRQRRTDGESPTDSNVGYYLLSGRDVLASDAADQSTRLADILEGDDLTKVRLLTKIMSGKSILSRVEADWIKKICTEGSEEREQLLALIEEHVAVWPYQQPLLMTVKRILGIV